MYIKAFLLSIFRQTWTKFSFYVITSRKKKSTNKRFSEDFFFFTTNTNPNNIVNKDWIVKHTIRYTIHFVCVDIFFFAFFHDQTKDLEISLGITKIYNHKEQNLCVFYYTWIMKKKITEKKMFWEAKVENNYLYRFVENMLL